MSNETMTFRVRVSDEAAPVKTVRVKRIDEAAPVKAQQRTVAFTGAFAGVSGQPGDYVARFVDVEIDGVSVGEKNASVVQTSRFRGLSLGGYVRGVFTFDADGDVIAVGRVTPV